MQVFPFSVPRLSDAAHDVSNSVCSVKFVSVKSHFFERCACVEDRRSANIFTNENGVQMRKTVNQSRVICCTGSIAIISTLNGITYSTVSRRSSRYQTRKLKCKHVCYLYRAVEKTSRKFASSVVVMGQSHAVDHPNLLYAHAVKEERQKHRS